MKKSWLFYAGGAVLAALILALVFLPSWRRSGGEDEVSRYVPREALAFARLNDLAGLSDRFPGTPLGRFLAKEDMTAMLGRLGAGEEVRAAYGRLCDDLANTLHNPGFRALFGDDLSVALLPPDPKRLREDAGAALRDAALVFATTPAASIATLLGGIAPGVKSEQEAGSGEKIFRLKIEGEEDVFAYGANGVLALAWNRDALLAAARARQSGANLRGQAGFQEAAAFWRSVPGAASRGYANTAGLFAWLELAAAELSADEAEAMRDLAAFYAGMDYAYDATAAGARGLEYRGRVRYRYGALHPLFRDVVDAKADAPFALLNGETLYFQWGSMYRLETLLAAIAEGEPEKYAEMREAAREGLGMEIEAAAAAFGPGWAAALNGISAEGLIPLPDLVLLAQVRDRARVERLAGLANRQLAAHGLDDDAPERRGDTLVYAWPVLREAGIAPTLGINDRAIFLGVFQDSVQPLIGDGAQRAALPEDIRALLGPELAERFARAGDGILLRPAKIADKCLPLVSFLGHVTGVGNVPVREIAELLQSGDALVGVTDWGRDALDWELAWIPAARGGQANPAGGQAGQAQ